MYSKTYFSFITCWSVRCIGCMLIKSVRFWTVPIWLHHTVKNTSSCHQPSIRLSSTFSFPRLPEINYTNLRKIFFFLNKGTGKKNLAGQGEGSDPRQLRNASFFLRIGTFWNKRLYIFFLSDPPLWSCYSGAFQKVFFFQFRYIWIFQGTFLNFVFKTILHGGICWFQKKYKCLMSIFRKENIVINRYFYANSKGGGAGSRP